MSQSESQAELPAKAERSVKVEIDWASLDRYLAKMLERLEAMEMRVNKLHDAVHRLESIEAR